MSVTGMRRVGAVSTTIKAASLLPFVTTWIWVTSWEHADTPNYPEQYSALGFRIGVGDYLVYAMTH